MSRTADDKHQRLISAINAAEQTAYGGDNNGVLADQRAQAIDMYLGNNLEPAPDGRSQVVDRSIFETVQWILPSLCRIFANGDDVVEIQPVGPEDEGGAKQESQYLNWKITQKTAWFETFLTWATDALLTKNAYCMAYREKLIQVETERYDKQTEEGLSLLLSEDGVKIVQSKSYPDPDYKPQPVMQQTPMGAQPMIDPATGQPAMQPPTMLYDVVIRHDTPEDKLCLKVLPPERCLVSEKTPSYRLADCGYFEYWEWKTISELRQAGFDLDDDVGSDNSRQDAPEDISRDQFSEASWNQDQNSDDPSLRRVKARMIWIKADIDEDGIAELIYCVRIGEEIVYQDTVTRIPVASFVPSPLPHRHYGLSIADITIDIQRIKTAILRGGLDNLYLANNSRTFITDKINLDDLLVTRPGGVVRGDNGAIFGQDIAPLQTPFVFPQAMEGLEYMDQVRENRTGTNRYFTGIDQNAMNKTATGIQQLSSMAAQRVEQIARIFATGIEDLFSICHELILRGGHKAEVVKLQGQWVEVDPAQWRKRTDFKIAVGYAAGNKDAMVQKLMMLLNFQKEALMGGVPVVTPQNVYETLVELTKASDLTAPERFWTDPKQIPPKQPVEDPIVTAQKIKSQADLQMRDKDAQQAQQEAMQTQMIEKFKADQGQQTAHLQTALDAHKAELDHHAKIYSANLSAHTAVQIEAMKERHQAEMVPHQAEYDSGFAKLAVEKEQGDKTADMGKQLTDTMKSQADALDKFTSLTLAGKRRVNRDKGGKAHSIDILGDDDQPLVTHKIARDAQGNITGSQAS